MTVSETVRPQTKEWYFHAHGVSIDVAPIEELDIPEFRARGLTVDKNTLIGRKTFDPFGNYKSIPSRKTEALLMEIEGFQSFFTHMEQRQLTSPQYIYAISGKKERVSYLAHHFGFHSIDDTPSSPPDDKVYFTYVETDVLKSKIHTLATQPVLGYPNRIALLRSRANAKK